MLKRWGGGGFKFFSPQSVVDIILEADPGIWPSLQLPRAHCLEESLKEDSLQASSFARPGADIIGFTDRVDDTNSQGQR